MDERQRLIEEANRLQARRRQEQEERERRLAGEAAAEDAFREYRDVLSDLFQAYDSFGREPADLAPLSRRLYETLVRTCAAFTSCGHAGRWPQVDRVATRESYTSSHTDQEMGRLAFDYGCLLLDRAFAGELTQEEVDHGWSCLPLRGCFGQAWILLSGIAGKQRIEFRKPAPPAPTPATAPNERPRTLSDPLAPPLAPAQPTAAASSPNPFQQLLDFAQTVYDTEFASTPRRPGQQRPCGSEWDTHFRGQEGCLRGLLDAALLDAERSGVGLPEVERRVQALAEHVMGMLLWPMRAPFQPRQDDGHCDVGAQEYLIGRHNEMRPAWEAVRTLAVRAERRGGPPDDQRPPRDTDKGGSMTRPWSAGVFLAKAKELCRRLRSWHLEDFKEPIQFVTHQEANHVVRRRFRDFIRPEIQAESDRPVGMQLWTYENGPDEEGAVGEACRNPDRDTSRSLSQWLLGDFWGRLSAAEPTAAVDYLRGAFDQLLELPAWEVTEPPEVMRSGSDDRTLMVIGREIPASVLDTLADAADKLLSAAPQVAAVQVPRQQTPVPAPLAPVKYLLSWREILDALGEKNGTENQRKIRQLNERYDGPIVLPAQGGQPKVNRETLLVWWNGLERRFDEVNQKREDATATLEARHDYGKDVTVLPDISGSVKRRRKPQRDE